MAKVRKMTENKVKHLALKRLGGDIILLYRLTEETELYYADCNTVYSLSVTKIDCGGRRREIKRAYDISRSKSEAERIFRLVTRGKVTPCTLIDTIEDLIS